VIAITWKEIDLVKRSIVNHINNNNWDNDSSNLEWVTTRENIEHGVSIGGKFSVNIYDTKKRTNKIYPSMTSAGKALGFSRITKIYKHKLVMNRYVVTPVNIETFTVRKQPNIELTLTNMFDKNIMKFTSLRKAALYLNVDKITLKKYLNNHTPLKGYTIARTDSNIGM